MTTLELPAATLLEFMPGLYGDDESGPRDVYNITAPFEFDGLRLIAGREETRQAPLRSRISFYAENEGAWHKVSQLENPKYELEDPFVTFIENRLILGAVQVDWQTEPLQFKTVFYDVENLDTFKPVAEGPMRMKDIRLKQLPGSEILVMTRPDRSVDTNIDRKIGFFKINNLSELTPERIQNEAVILEGMFDYGEWGGANEVHIIDDDWVGVLAHRAHRNDLGNLRYTSTVFELNHQTGQFTPMRELFCRDDFPVGPAKTDQLQDVVFSGGLIRHDNGMATWYGGLSDATAGYHTKEDPFRLPQDAFFPTAA